MLSLKSVHSGIGQPFIALVCAQWDRRLFSFVKWPQWDAQPQKCAQWDRSALFGVWQIKSEVHRIHHSIDPRETSVQPHAYCESVFLGLSETFLEGSSDALEF